MTVVFGNIIFILALFLFPVIGISAEKHPAAPALPMALPTPDENYLLNHGEMSTTRYLGGALVGSFIGIGSGHAIQGRFFNKGLYFLSGEFVGILLLEPVPALVCGGLGKGVDFSKCEPIQTAGLVIFLATKAWEIFDLWVIPPLENSEYRELIKKYPDKKRVAFQPFIFPTSSNGLVAGLAMSF